MADPNADKHIERLERQLYQADKRIADLESAIRQRETLDHARHRDGLGLLDASRRQCAELLRRLADTQSATRSAAETAASACERLELYQPVINAARDLIDAYERDDDHAGTAACQDIKAAVARLPPVPS